MAAVDELSLLERVFLRVGTAETDEQLQNVIAKFLLPVLMKLSSQQEGVRKKVMELLVHINKRVKSRSNVQLPVEALFLQYQDPSATSFIINFTIIYIKMGYSRMDVDKQVQLLPNVLKCLEGKPQLHQDSLLFMLMPVLGHVKPMSDVGKRKGFLGLSEKPDLAKYIGEFMLDMLLLPYGSVPLDIKTPQIQTSQASSGDAFVVQPHLTPPPGLSEYSFRRASGETPFNAEELAKVKLGIVKFLSAGFLDEEIVVVPLIVAVSDTRHSVVDAAEMELKRIISGVDMNSGSFVSKLYSLFLGTLTVKDNNALVKQELKRSAANSRIRMKLMPYLLKSREAAIRFPSCIQVVFDCLFSPNNTNQKLKHLAVQFVHHICLNCSDDRLSPIGPVLLAGMRKLLVKEVTDDAKLRGLAYVAIAKLGHKLPQLVIKDIEMLQSFFEAALEEVQETRLAVQEALSIMCGAFKSMDAANKKIVEGLLTTYIDKPESRVRLLAIQYATAIFPSNHIPTRYLLLLSSGDSNEEVYSEAAKALKTVPTKTKFGTDLGSSDRFPPFVDMITYINEKAEQRLTSKQKFVIGTQTLPFNPVTCNEIVTYLRMCLRQDAGLSPFVEEADDERPVLSKYLHRAFAENQGNARAALLYVDFIKLLVKVTGSVTAMFRLLELVAFAPTILAPQFVSQLDWIKGLVFSTKEDMRCYSSQLYAVVVANSFDSVSFAAAVAELMKFLNDPVFERQHGAVYAVGYTLSRKSLLLERSLSLKQVVPVSSEAVCDIVKCLRHGQSIFVNAACVVLGEIGRFGNLPLPNVSEASDDQCTKLSVINDLIGIVKSSKHNTKIREKAATAVGYICIGEQDFPHRKVAMEGLLECASEKTEVDLHFTIGEALSWTALGVAANVRRDFWTVSVDDYAESIKDSDCSSADNQLQWLLSKICDEYIRKPNPHVRQAACVWLLSLLKCSGSRAALKNHLEKLQNIFVRLLSESNETTQDVASKGLGLIYEICDEGQKNVLVSALVSALTDGQRPNQQVTEETKIFEEGTLGSAPHGGSLSTYKELCSLASDLNQPDLIYRFMHLANHNAVWNSKKGAAFGFSMIAAKAGEQLQPYLPQIVPKLYRYQYDPNGKIQQSMRSIWNAIVSDPQKTVDKYLKEILADVKSNLVSGLWRTRESSCLALADLLKGRRQLCDHVGDLADLWSICFRVQDDIKESVRLAAEVALKALSKVSVKLCDANAGNSGCQAIGTLFPVLLKEGLSSPVLEVRTISLATITEISKTAGPLLKPNISLLVTALLESLSSLESQQLSYLSVRLGGSQENTQEKLDNARISVAKSSVMMETINKCLLFVDDQVLVELVPRLVDLMKNSVGLGTKAGCAFVASSLTTHCLNDLQPHAGKLLSALLFGLNDRSAAVRKTYAGCIGHVVKAAKDSSVDKIVSRLQAVYLENEEAAARANCACVFGAIAKQSPDVLKAHQVRILPLAFLAMHAKKKTTTTGNVAEASHHDDDDQSTWEEIWSEASVGSESSIRLYLPEIVDLVEVALQSQSWSLKAQGAACVCTVATTLKESLQSPHLDRLVRATLPGLSGRTWDGKKNFVGAVAAICVNCRVAVEAMSRTDPSTSVENIVDAMLKECQKEQLEYKLEAIGRTADILDSCNVDRFRAMFDVICQLLKRKALDKSGVDSDDDDDGATCGPDTNRARLGAVAIHEVCFRSLGKSWPTNEETQGDVQQTVAGFLCSFLDNRPLKIQVVVTETLKRFVERLHCLHPEGGPVSSDAENILAIVLPPICTCAAIKSNALRSNVLAIFDVVLSSQKDGSSFVTQEQLGSIRSATNQILSESQSDLREQASRVLKHLS